MTPRRTRASPLTGVRSTPRAPKMPATAFAVALPVGALHNPVLPTRRSGDAVAASSPARLAERRGAGAAGLRCTMTPYLKRLVRREDLTRDAARAAVDFAVGGSASEAEIAAFVALLAAKGETAAEISGVVDALRARMVPVVTHAPAIDIVGTGGDGLSTVNISTAASIVAAAAGCVVAKHGNRSVSSKAGSADALEALGVRLSLPPEAVERCIRDVGIGFMFAPNHHPAMRFVAPVRKALGIRTVFNIVGPFLSPCRAAFGVIGVYKPKLLQIGADVLAASPHVERAVVVHTAGMDEFSNTGVAQCIEVRGGEQRPFTLDAEEELGMARVPVDALKGGDAETNADVIRRVVGGTMQGAVADAIALNAGVACWIYGLDDTIGEGVLRAKQTLASGAGLPLIRRWAEVTQAEAV